MLPFAEIHPGALVALHRLNMDELGVARAIAAGQLTSPQHYDNVWLFALRITGTGAAFRPTLKEFVYRDPSIYLNDEFLARCNGLAVIWEHPGKRDKLNSEEYAKRNIGSIVLPYIQGDEVWGIAKIYDDDAAKEMCENTWSTSPAVTFDKTSDNKIFTLDDGKKLLVEGKPVLLDHLAICEQGVWDKGGEPTGVSSITRKDSNVAEETKEEREAREDRARNDADAGKKLDRLLSGLDSLSSRMDAFEGDMKSRKDAEEKDEKEKDEKARVDRKARMDAEHAEFEKEDGEACAKDDADEETDKKKFMEEGEPEETAVDRARADRIARRDQRRKDAAKKDAAKKDGDNPSEMDPSMNDSGKITLTKAEFDAMREKLSSIERSLPAMLSNEDRIAFSDEQARADSAYTMLGMQAPAPMQGETFKAYRSRLARPLQKYSKTWKDIDLNSLGAEPLAIGAQQIYADSTVAAARADDIPAGEYREVARMDPATGMRSVSFYGPNTIFRRMTTPTRRVTGLGVKSN